MKRNREEASDFQTSTHAIGFAERKSTNQVFAQLFKPKALMYVGIGLLVVASLLIIPKMYLVGYLVGVLGSIALSGSLLRDQRSQATSDYVFLKWFRPSVVSIRLLIFVVSFAHIISLALEKAR
jgi:hypothetical protein